MSALIPLEEAQNRLLALAKPLPIERVSIPDTLGRYLAEPLLARRTQPAADLSAMDGYAIQSCSPLGPWQVVGESAAGHPYAGTVAPGEAIRISTGALLPHGADAVIVQEDCQRSGDRLAFIGTPPSPIDKHIRRRGLDYTEGTLLLPAGTRIGPAHIALALSSGHKHVPVHRVPRIAIIDSGDELAPHDAECSEHQIPASNGAMLAALASALPCQISRIGPIPDHLSALIAALDAASDADIIVTSGGASVGDHDLIQPALSQWGATINFWKIAIKPGKPLLVATRGTQIILGLPGNPVASYVTGFFFLLPLIRALSGAAATLPRPSFAPLTNRTGPTGDRREFQRGRWDGQAVEANPMRDSSALAALALSNCLIDRPAGSPALEPGTPVPIYLLENGGIC